MFVRAREALAALKNAIEERTAYRNELRARVAALEAKCSELGGGGGDCDDDELFPQVGSRRDYDFAPTVIESFCASCEKNGETRLLLTSIPFFKQIVLSSFECPHCGFKNTSCEPINDVEPTGVKLLLKLKTESDYTRRQIVKSQHASVKFFELDLEIPPFRGSVSTVEGLLNDVADDLSARISEDESSSETENIRAFVEKVKQIQSLQPEMTLQIDDPSGNSYIENFLAPKIDPNLKVTRYRRSREQNKLLQWDDSDLQGSTQKPEEKKRFQGDPTEVTTIPAPCPACASTDEFCNMAPVEVPFFAKLLLMSFSCEKCGYKDTEIKSAGPISPMASEVVLKVDSDSFGHNMARDVVKSSTSSVRIVELDLEATSGSLGSMYTTVEGLLVKFKERLFDSDFVTAAKKGVKSDSTKTDEKTELLLDLERRLDSLLAGDFESARLPNGFTLEIVDPLGQSHIFTESPHDDPYLKITSRVRTRTEDSDLGLHDMNVDDYDLNVPQQTNEETLEKMAKLQEAGDETHPYQQFSKGDDVQSP